MTCEGLSSPKFLSSLSPDKTADSPLQAVCSAIHHHTAQCHLRAKPHLHRAGYTAHCAVRELMQPACPVFSRVCSAPDCRVWWLWLSATPRAAPHARHGQWNRGPSAWRDGGSGARLSHGPPRTPRASSWAPPGFGAIHDGRRTFWGAPWTSSQWPSPPSPSSPQRWLSMREGFRHRECQTEVMWHFAQDGDCLLSAPPNRLCIVQGRSLLDCEGFRKLRDYE